MNYDHPIVSFLQFSCLCKYSHELEHEIYRGCHNPEMIEIGGDYCNDVDCPLLEMVTMEHLRKYDTWFFKECRPYYNKEYNRGEDEREMVIAEKGWDEWMFIPEVAEKMDQIRIRLLRVLAETIA